MAPTPNPNDHPLRVIGIDPGTREIGYAVLEGERLEAFGVYTIAYGVSVARVFQKTEAFISTILERIQPHVVAIECAIPAPSRRAALLWVLVGELKRAAWRRNLRVLSYYPTHVKKVITGNGHATKHELAATLVQRYPELTRYRTDDGNQIHWEHMFDALAVALVANRETASESTES